MVKQKALLIFSNEIGHATNLLWECTFHFVTWGEI